MFWVLKSLLSTQNRAGPRGVGYGGALQAQNLNKAAQAVSGGSMSMSGGLIGGGFGGAPPKIFKIYVSENAFQAIFKPSFPYSITSVLSKVRHSNPRGWGRGYSDIFIHT